MTVFTLMCCPPSDLDILMFWTHTVMNDLKMPNNHGGVCHSLQNSLVWANRRLYTAVSQRDNMKDRPKYADGM